MNMNSAQVIVAGAGPVGLVTALGLAQAGVEVVVLDKDQAVGTAPRAMAYLYAVLDGFDRLGVLDELDRDGIRVGGMNFIDHETGEHIWHSFAPVADLVRHPHTLHLGQDQLSAILLRQLGERPNVRVRYGAELTAVMRHDRDQVTVAVATPEGESTLTAAWLIGADGANSATRKSIGVGFSGFTWPDRLVAANIRHDLAACGFAPANCQIDRVHGAIIAQINNSGLWRYAYRESGDAPADAGPLAERVQARLAAARPELDGVEVVACSPYRIHQRAADAFRVGRVLLAGDAAHITNPIGGLGLVTGLLDAFTLSEALAAVIAGQADEAVLDAYADRRRRVFLDVVSPMAIRNKRRLFDPPVGADRARMLAGLRQLANDPDARRAEILGLRAVVTPSLLAERG